MTAETFMGSQGSYGRLYHSLLMLDEDERTNLNGIDELSNCNSVYETMMYLEG